MLVNQLPSSGHTLVPTYKEAVKEAQIRDYNGLRYGKLEVMQRIINFKMRKEYETSGCI